MGGIKPDFVDPFASARNEIDTTTPIDPFTEARQPVASEIATEFLKREATGIANPLSTPLARSVLTAPIKIGENIVEAVSHPGRTVEAAAKGIGKGVEDVIGMGEAVAGAEGVTGKAKATAYLAKSILYDGFIRPILVQPLEASLSRDLHVGATFGEALDPDEAQRRGDEAVANYAGLFLGMTVGKAISRAGKAAKAIEEMTGSKIGRPQDLATALANISDDATHVAIIEKLNDMSTFNNFSKGIIEGSTGGVAAGLLIGDTPEERFNNAFSYGLAGAVIGGTLETAFGRKGSKYKPYAEEARIANISTILQRLPPADNLIVQVDLANGVPFDAALTRRVKAGETAIIHNLDEVSTEVKNREAKTGMPTFFYRSPEGKISVLVDNVSDNVMYKTILKMEEARAEFQADPTNQAKAAKLRKLLAEVGVHERKLQVWGDKISDFAAKLQTPTAMKLARLIIGEDQFNPLMAHVKEVAKKELGIENLPYQQVDPNDFIAINGMMEVAARAIITQAERMALIGVPRANKNYKGFIIDIPAKLFFLEQRHIDAFQRTGFIERQVGTVNGRLVAVENATTKGKLVVRALNNGERLIVDRNKFKPGDELISADFTEKGDRVISTQSEVLGTQVSRQDIHVKDIEADLTPEELAILNNNRAAIERATKDIADEQSRRVAATGFNLEYLPSGKILIRQRDGLAKGVIDNLSQMDEYLPDVRGAAKDPFETVGGLRLLPPEKGGDPQQYSPAEAFARGRRQEKWLDRFRLGPLMQKITHSAQVFRSIENLSDVPVFTHAFLPLQKALREFRAAIKPHVEAIADLSKNKMRNWLPERRELITDWIETATPQEKIREMGIGAMEQAMVEKHVPWIKGLRRGIEPLKRVNRWMLQEKIVLAMAKKNPPDFYINGQLDLVKFNNIMKKWAEANLEGGDLTPNEYSLMNDMRYPPDQNAPYSPWHFRTLLESRILDTPSRKEFEARNKMTPEEIAVGHEIEAMFSRLADELGIPESRRLWRYISHLQRYQNVKTFDMFNPIDKMDMASTQFFADLQRVGLMADVIKDPIDILIRYVNAGYKNRIVNPVRVKAGEVFNQLVQTRGKMTDRNSQRIAKEWSRLVDEWRTELEDVMTPSEIVAVDATDMYLDHIGMKNKTERAGFMASFMRTFNPMRQLEPVNLIKNIEMATQGARAVAGLRDATTVSQIALLRFGPVFVGRMAKGANLMEAWRTRKALGEAGVIPSQAMTLLEGADDQAARAATEAALGHTQLIPEFFDTIREFTFKASLQPQVYEFAHALFYNTITSITTESLNNWALGKITRAKMEGIIKLDTYSAPVIKEFNRILAEGDPATKIKEASELLAHDAGFELMNHFGKANSPKLMWSKWGKVAGQFGQWPLWYLNGLADQVARASPKRKAYIAAMLGLSTGGMYLAQQQTRFKLDTWSLNPANSFNRNGINHNGRSSIQQINALPLSGAEAQGEPDP